MNEWLIWIIIVIVMFGGITLWRYLSTKKRTENYRAEIKKGQDEAKQALKDAQVKAEQIRKEKSGQSKNA